MNSDCLLSISRKICKEIRPGGSKICQKPKSCRQKCRETEYCTAENECKDKLTDESNAKK